MRQAKILLQELKRVFPVPPGKGNHSILLEDDGRLLICVKFPDFFARVFLDENDLDRDAIEYSESVIAMVHWQLETITSAHLDSLLKMTYPK